MVEQSEIDVKIDELEILVEEYKILLPKIAEFYNRIANSSEIIHPSIKDSILSAIELSRNFSNTFDKNLLIRKCKEDNKYGISFLHDVDFIIENLIEMTKLYRAHDIKYILQEKSDSLSDIKYIFDKTNNKISIIVKISNTDPKSVYEDLIENIILNEQKIKNIYEESNRLVQRIRNQTVTTGASSTHKFFEDTANDYEYASLLWAFITSALFVFAAYILYKFDYKYIPDIKDENGIENIYPFYIYIFKKIITFSIIIYGIIFSSKIYMANKHNYIINKHKQNVADSLINFAGSESLQDKKDIILTYAANCIYSQQETGFNNKSSGGSNPSAQITKVAEAIGKLASKSSP